MSQSDVSKAEAADQRSEQTRSFVKGGEKTYQRGGAKPYH